MSGLSPNRHFAGDGYGPNASVYKYFIEQQGVSFDCDGGQWSAGHEAIDLLSLWEWMSFVTDHHSMPEAFLPDAAIVHPEHPESNYPLNI